MAYGQYNESVARTLFIEKLQKAVRPAGLFIDEEFGFLGASPDGVDLLAKYSPAPYPLPRTLRVKVLVSTVIMSNIQGKAFIGLCSTYDSPLHIQGQLRVCKMQKCYFVGYISPTYYITVLEIERDENFIRNMLPKLFNEGMHLKYDQAAKDAGVYIVSACGIESIPNDMGLVYMQQNFDGTLNSVVSYMSTDLPRKYYAEARERGLLNYGTWESLIYALEHSNELGPLRKKQFPEKLPTFKPKVPLRSTIHKHEGAWCLPIAIADLLVVYRTQRWFYENEHKRPVQFRPYYKLGGFMTTVAISLVCIIGFLMSKISVTKRLLLNYPSNWRSIGEAYVQQWTSLGWYEDEVII
ncbi:hypothetical protein MSG28_007856 [Choristoneura fumiferana]|uniref:Uncharacterized protein n=1 Tax=Choristoneura fumiferana TaxID=7141 RepID=A0ACC0J943_CHOFU|nr:hypothetical protein MSG28_007856 [Choristoneura fumiferana]